MRRPGFLGDLSDTWFGATKLRKLQKEISRREAALEEDDDDDDDDDDDED